MRNLATVRKHLSPYSFINAKDSVFCRGENSCLYVVEKGSGLTGARLIRSSADGFNGPECLCQGEEALNDVFLLQFVPTTGCLFMATNDGAFLQTSDTSAAELQELFRSEEGIAWFSVSPDCRFVAIMTKKRTILLLTLPDLECIAQHQLVVSSEKSHSFEIPITFSSSVSIVWRSDSKYFAVNFPVINAGAKVWQIKVYDEDGALFSTTEDSNPLLNQSLEWQPSGGLIASYGKSAHGNVIVLFELNGLKRADFSPFDGQKEDNEEVLDIVWNSASDILAVILKNSVELWTRNNYVWMRKMSLRLSNDTIAKEITYAEWDAELPNRIHVVFNDGSYIAYNLTLTYTSGLSSGSALTASWNGKNVYCTPFRDNCAPPPYGFLQGTVDEDITTVLVSNFWDGLLCITTGGKAIVMKNEKTSLSKFKTYQCPDDVRSAECWVWSSKSTLSCICNGGIMTFNLQDFESNATNTELKVEKSDFIGYEVKIGDPGIPKQKQFSRIFPLSDDSIESQVLLAETVSNDVIKVNLNTHEKQKMCKLPHTCSTIIPMKISDENNLIIFAHDPLSMKLFAGWSKHPDAEPLKISVDCTSFSTFCGNLLLTTSQGSLEILNKNSLIQTLEEGFINHEIDQLQFAERKFSRKVEKGSLIVTCCLNQMLEPALVLQIIPRGNIETIHPRPLLISTLRLVLREKENQSRYEKIMVALRRHRLDYKVLIEEMKNLELEDPEITLEASLKLMVDQVKDSHSLVLLVTDLEEGQIDCIKIIKNLLEGVVLGRKDEKVRSPNIEEAYLASLAKLGLLEEALKSSLIEGENKENRNFVTHRVKFLSYYCDNPDILFDTAIGTYDLTLASLVADCLGKDPKEYLPLLDGFQSLPERKRMYKIDDRLRRYSKAIINLIKDESVQHDEILKYMERHRLFTDVLEFFKKASRNQDTEMNRTQEDVSLLVVSSKAAYGKYLEEHGKLKEASILYRGGEMYEKAIDCAVKSGSWETALEISYSQDLNQEQMAAVCERILDSLEENKNYTGAARVSEIHLNDAQRAVGYWLRDRRWLTARALARKYSDLGDKCVEETIRPKLIEAAFERSEYLGDLQTEIIAKIQRLRDVKAVKARRILEFGDDGMGDNFSDTDSVSTGSFKSGSVSTGSGTGKTFRSGKSRRKLERKLYSMKEGSLYEDLGLIAHLWSLFDKIQHEIKPDTSYLIEALWNFELNDVALRLGIIFDNLLIESNKVIQEIWATVLNDELLELRYRVPPVGWTTSWDKLCLHEPSSKAGKH